MVRGLHSWHADLLDLAKRYGFMPPLYQLNKKIRRRERVIRIFPNDHSALRPIGAMLSEQNEVWQE
jgi:transposase-like protein